LNKHISQISVNASFEGRAHIQKDRRNLGASRARSKKASKLAPSEAIVAVSDTLTVLHQSTLQITIISDL